MSDLLNLLMMDMNDLRRRLDVLETIEQIGADTQALGNAVSMFLALPGLVGFWPGNAGKDSGGNLEVWDYAPNQLNLSRATWTSSNNGLAPYILFAGGSDVAYHADTAPLDITGGEAYLEGVNNGISVGGWFYSTAAAGTLEVLMAKAAGAGVTNYKLQRLASGAAQFVVASASADYTVSHTALSQNTWHFVVGRFDPSTALRCRVDGSYNSNTTSIPATADTNAEPFTIGALSDGLGSYTSYWSGRASMCFVCQSYLPDDLVSALYRATVPLFK